MPNHDPTVTVEVIAGLGCLAAVFLLFLMGFLAIIAVFWGMIRWGFGF